MFGFFKTKSYNERMTEKFDLLAERITFILNERTKDKKTIERLEKENKAYRDFIENISKNYNCDEDGHRYKTGCRCCEANELLKRKE